MNISGKNVAGIILGAGSSTRMGKIKQLMPYKQTTILGQVIASARQSMLHEIIVVLGCNADTIRQTLEFAGTTIVVNPGFSHGQSTSLKAGLSKLSVECHGAMFLLGDQPLITPEIINQIINAFVASDSSVVAPYYNNRRGNPVIIARDLFHRLNSVSGDTGARSLIHDYENRMIKVRVPDDAIVFDVDTPADYAELLSREK